MHRWGLSKARHALYNAHTLKHTLYCVMHVEHRSTLTTIRKRMYTDMTYEWSKHLKCLLKPNTHTNTHAALWDHEESTVWRAGPFRLLHKEGQAEKDRWWCTSDFNSQGTSSCSPGCCTLSRTINWPRTTERTKTKWMSLVSWKGIKRQLKIKRNKV